MNRHRSKLKSKAKRKLKKSIELTLKILKHKGGKK